MDRRVELKLAGCVRAPRRALLLTVVALAATVSGCAPAAPAGPRTDPAPGASPPAAQSGPKTLILAQDREIDGITRTGRTAPEVTHTASAGYAAKNSETLESVPWMAEELPSLDKGTWRLNDDGTMVTTWRLRPNIKWHDGTPFSTRDSVFGWEVNQDPQVPENNRRPGDLMAQLETPDDRTLVIHWKNRYPQAGALLASEFRPLPRHILEPVYRAGDYNVFNNNPYWSTEFVHLGPFKVARFEIGSHVEFLAHDEYFLGRPKVDRIIFRIIPDPNTALANVLANEVDVILGAALSVEGGIVADRDWASRGDGTVKFTPLNWTWVNPSGTNPIFGWEAPNHNRIRQAMLHSINRQDLVDTLFHGKEQVIHFPLSPGRRQFQAADAVATKYAYDPRRAEQLFAEAGWRKGADGILVNERGERFSTQFRSSAGENELLAAVAAYLKEAGIETQQLVLSDTQDNSREYRNRWPGLYLGRFNLVVESWFDRFHLSRAPNEANDWRQFGVPLWPDPAKDRILEDLNNTIDPRQIDQLMVEFVRLYTRDLPHLPIKFNAEVTTYRNYVKNVPVRYESGGNGVRVWNIHLWEKV